MSEVVRKLGIKRASHVVMLGVPASVAPLLEPLPEGSSTATTTGRTPADVVLLFAADTTALADGLPAAANAVKPGGLFWVAYRKGGTDLNRDSLRAHLQQHDLAGVALVAIDSTWSAMRFRPTSEVGR